VSCGNTGEKFHLFFVERFANEAHLVKTFIFIKNSFSSEVEEQCRKLKQHIFQPATAKKTEQMPRG
jgi:hypothetical protein